MQPGRRLVEDEELARCRVTIGIDGMLAEMRDQLQPLRFAAGKVFNGWPSRM